MGKVLKRHDYRVFCADTGAQGLEMIRSQCPDIILLDLGLPDMNGDDLISEVRTWTSTRSSSFQHAQPNGKKYWPWTLEQTIILQNLSAPPNCLRACGLLFDTATD